MCTLSPLRKEPLDVLPLNVTNRYFREIRRVLNPELDLGIASRKPLPAKVDRILLVARSPVEVKDFVVGITDNIVACGGLNAGVVLNVKGIPAVERDVSDDVGLR